MAGSVNMRCGCVAVACIVVLVVVCVAVPGSSSRQPSLATTPPASAPNTTGHHQYANATEGVRHGGKEDDSHVGGGEKSEPPQQSTNVVRAPGGENLSFTPAQILALRKLLMPPPEERTPSPTVQTKKDGWKISEEVRWQCFLQWLRAHSYKSKKDQRTCSAEEREQNALLERKSAKECMPLLLLVVPALCNGTQSCVNLTEASMEELLHRYVVWERKKRRQAEADDAVIYIVVVLAFYSFGIVFMIANFVRQEQRELEETNMYKQYVKVARDRWLTTRGNMANKLALQALNTFNAIPQTTDVNKVTFV
ncbi:uncharacterized protein LOC127009563 isoform X1 [Eriocheir sinensis]|uniref:uncharacterized protein LOC127009563 isoform X1 n=2 Tax=Eriocheir sinensis TaxID=95602 RepID=UPI0021C89BD4|nr:uncharacterized protein LOC127009563 isoform X1 [Eriocheir sinensis]